MRIVSVNLNQRLGNSEARSRFESWLQTQAPDLLLAQEPFKIDQQDRPGLRGYRLIGTTALISCWIADQHEDPRVIEHSERWHEIRFKGLAVHNVYLSPHSSKERRDLLLKMAVAIEQSDEANHVVLGDFNLAPRLEDGVFGNQPSAFTKPSERQAFLRLTNSRGLVDMTCPQKGVEIEFTFEQAQRGRAIRFRCDLGLLSAGLRNSATVRYDHSVRTSAEAFTDHSAILLDLPYLAVSAPLNMGISRAERQGPEVRPRGAADLSSAATASHKTAIKRCEASQVARNLYEQGVLNCLGVGSILDFGCGYGQDVRFYRSVGLDADGFDVEPRFQWTRCEDREYDLVTLVFVINVLPSIEDRLAAVREAARFVRRGGYLLVAARSESAIQREARRGGWSKFSDGWISVPGKGTFQKGIRTSEIAWLLGAVGFQIAECALRLSSDVSWLLGTNRPMASPSRREPTGGVAKS